MFYESHSRSSRDDFVKRRGGAHLQDGDIKSAATQIEDEDGLVLLAIEAVCQGGSGGLVDDAQHLDASDAACVLGGLALAVVEVRGHRDDGLLHLYKG